MFIETHPHTTENGIPLTFIKSLNVQSFPCGRRRSNLVGFDSNNDSKITEDEKYYIPFDPEARLNTEDNNRKHSSLNGYTQTYIKAWDVENNLLSIVLAGYLFNIKLVDLIDGVEKNYCNIADFIEGLATNLELSEASDAIFANIRVEKTLLFERKGTSYYTQILRDQTQTANASAFLDVATNPGEVNNLDSYYFSGLSFSATALSSLESPESQEVISLKLLEKVGGVWQICQTSLLPKIEHGHTEDSIQVNTIYANNLYITKDGTEISVPALKVQKVSNEPVRYQLQFTNASVDHNIIE